LSSPTDERNADLFPWMRRAIVAGAVIGAVVAVKLGRLTQRGLPGVIVCALLGAIVGILVGVCVAFCRAVEVPANPQPSPDLWDAWLDSPASPNDEEPAPTSHFEGAGDDSAGETGHWRARVRPRVLSSETGESLPLTDVIGPILQGSGSGLIRLVGRSGAGKTTALKHLSGLLPPHLDVSLLDEPRPSEIVAAPRGWVVFTSDSARRRDALDHLFVLAPWGEDEWIEYLLATDRRLCGSVIARLRAANSSSARLEGIPELWGLVLDRMIADQSLPDALATLKSELAALMPDEEIRELIESACFAAIARNDRSAIERADDIHRQSRERLLPRLIRHRPVQLLLAADFIARAIENRAEFEALAAPLPRDLVQEAASRIARNSDLVERLRSLLTIDGLSQHPMVASLLHALRFGWKPCPPLPRLAGAYLEYAVWPEINLTGTNMRNVDLGGANLQASRLDSARLDNANLAGAILSATSMTRATCDGADLSRAKLMRASARQTGFKSSRLVDADLGDANFDKATFEFADLSHARLTGASLVGVDLRSAKIDGADFFGADLRGANLERLCLSRAHFARARFRGANLAHCNLEGMLLPGACFMEADLIHALLTGSRMPGANFRDANLRAAGLAEVDWEEADLRGADLREAAFHLGSSRSGLVGSPIASEGSRTGFYTDDWNEQDFKSPEEIRKANLCGADLRGARIDDVDFYLVDLRGALLDPEQIPHIRRCGAILEARA
jgi:uncharacterized protein YjbI with pentapeptide repeats/energy-coupling factor transporter ATP-binding protein EcfA2